MKSRSLVSGYLGYGGALLLTAIALAILIDPFLRGGDGGGRAPAAAGAGRPSTGAFAPGADAPPTSIEPSLPRTEPTRPSITRGPVRRNPVAGTVRPPRCSPLSAFYERSGDTVRVTVRFPGNGYVAAFVELQGRSTVTKSATNTGQAQSFLFTGVPENITRRVGVTAITQRDMLTCEAPRRG
jgi:hypothetical protein